MPARPRWLAMHHHHLDRFAQNDSPIHRLDARAKLVAIVAYTVVLLSFGYHSVAALAPMAILPLAMLWFARVPVWFALRRVLILSPLLLTLALAGPLYDASPRVVAFGPWSGVIRGGWLTAAVVVAEFALSIFALTALMSTTPFALLLEAMRRLRVPKALVMQLGFLYRYLFVLIDEAMRLRLARDFRGAARAPLGRRLRAAGGAIGSLFIRTLEHSERIHLAMRFRGYRGEPYGLQHLRFTARDALFLGLTTAYLAACRGLYPLLLAV